MAIQKFKPSLLFKFDYCNNYYNNQEISEQVKMFRKFAAHFKDATEAAMFLDNVFYTATVNHCVLETLYYNDSELDDKSRCCTQLFDAKELEKINNIDEFITFLSVGRPKKISVAHLTQLKYYLNKTDEANEKLAVIAEMICKRCFYLILNKHEYPVINSDDRTRNRILLDMIIPENEFAQDMDIMYKIMDYFSETQRIKAPKGTYGGSCEINERVYTNKMVNIHTASGDVLIEESRKNTLAKGKLSVNFLALPSTRKNFKKKSVQLFEILDDNSKLTIINCLRI